MNRRLPRGARLHNPGNIRHARGVIWQGQAEGQPDSDFVAFKAPEWGIRAMCRVLITYQDKRRAEDGSAIDTVAEFIQRWAPPVENDTDSYIASARQRIAQFIDYEAGQAIDVTDYATMRGMVEAITVHELGFQPYDEAVIAKGITLAGIEPPGRTVYEVLRPAPKPLSQSGTVQFGTTAAVASGGMFFTTLLERFMGFVEGAGIAQLVFAAIVVLAVAGVIWRYVDDRKRGLRDVDTRRLARDPR